MSAGKKFIWGGLGWVLGGPIGGIIGYALASMSEKGSASYYKTRPYPKTQGGDFIVSLLVLFAAVMKADKKMLNSELEYIKRFLNKQFSRAEVSDFMILFKDIIKQKYPLRDVCLQIQRSMDHPSRLELIHVLFELSNSDGQIHPAEIKVIHTIAGYLNINAQDFISIKAMFGKGKNSVYEILEIKSTSTDIEVKKAYRKMANKYHPDKVIHLGQDFQQLAEEKFKAVNSAYHKIKKDRGIS